MLSETNTIDSIGISKANGEVILTLVDEQDWTNEEEHLTLLQEKINAYIRFIESGEIFQTYPDAQDRKVAIDVVSRYTLIGNAMSFLMEAAQIVGKAGIELRSHHLQE